jgi:hypothetical protein
MKQSICEICSHMTEVTSGTGSRFLLCQLSQTDRRFPKYPPQPVIRCEGFIDGKTSRIMNLNLIVLPETIAICRLDADSPIPDWAIGEFVSITRTADELSIVCRQDQVPKGVQCERSWRCFRVAARLDFTLVGVIASLTGALAEAGISVFVVSSFNTDFVLVREQDLAKAVGVLEEDGHNITGK